jgi:hypothetical protein
MRRRRHRASCLSRCSRSTASPSWHRRQLATCPRLSHPIAYPRVRPRRERSARNPRRCPRPRLPRAPFPTRPNSQRCRRRRIPRRTRASLANATRDLDRIDVRTLNSDAKAQFDIARRFVAQASTALNAKNFEFAQQLADKAATLAALLQKH